MGYEWATAVSQGTSTPVIDGDPPWLDDVSQVGMAVQGPSPVGEGDLLVRTMFSATIGVRHFPTTVTSLIPTSLAIDFLADVDSSAGPPPNPYGIGVSHHVLSASTTAEWQITDPYGPTGDVQFTGVWSTAGVVTSHARRGVAKYGPIHPYVNVGVGVKDAFRLTVDGGHMTVDWTFILRTLWLVP